MEDEPGGSHRLSAISREGTADGATRAAHERSCGVRAPCQFACKRPEATHPLVQGLLGMAGGFRDGLGGGTPVREMTQWVRHGRQGLGHGSTEGGRAVRDDSDYGPLERLLHLASECRQIVLGGRQQTPSEEYLTGETSAQAPEDCMAHVGLEASEGQGDATAGLREALEAERLLQREGAQCVVTLQEIGDRPWGSGHAALAQRLVDCRDTPVVAVAPLANAGNNLQATCRLGECQGAFCFRPIWLATLRPSGGEAAPHLEREPQDCCQGGTGRSF